MDRTTQSHASKTQVERRRYWKTVIQAPAGPTLEDTAPVIDTTDRTAVTEEAQPAAYAPTKPPSVIRGFLHDKGVELLIGVGIIGLLGWGAYQLYALNREVGELTSNLNNARAAQSLLNSEIEKVEQRLVGLIEGVSSDVDRQEWRIDGLIESRLQRRKSISE